MIKMVRNRCVIRIFIFLIVCILKSEAEYNELKMVHVIFRHGERTPSMITDNEGYPNDPYLNYSFFPYGVGSLINDGKQSMYELGTFLRRRYNDFLGDSYHPGVARVRSTESFRAMMSAALVSAGLWPPSENLRWNKDLPWIPIPYEYVSRKTDSLMLSYNCPTYINEYERIYHSDEVQKLVEPHRNFFAYLTEHSGKWITTVKEVFFLYHTLESEVNCNLTLPTWTNGYFPDGEMYDVALLFYDIGNWGDSLKRIYGGPLVRKVLYDYGKFIHSTESSRMSSSKIRLYSGHESNIASVLKTLGVWFPHIPDFSSAIIFELLMNKSKNEFAVQILYYMGKSGKMIHLTVPGCTEICPVHKLRNLLSNVIPHDVDKLCGMNVGSRGFHNSLDITLCIALQIWILHFILEQ